MHYTVKEDDAGKYMVRATNAGGEAQSIADVAVFEPKPDTMVEVHKTVIYENIQDKSAVQVFYYVSCTKKFTLYKFKYIYKFKTKYKFNIFYNMKNIGYKV